MKQIIFPKLKTVLTRYKTQTVAGKHGDGFMQVKDGQEEIFFEVSIDIDSLEIMAHTATKNKSQCCMSGCWSAGSWSQNDHQRSAATHCGRCGLP